jgi:hypothetical protein
MVDPATTHGKRLAMIAWGKNEDGSDDVAVFTGVAEWDGAVLMMRREPEASSFAIPPGWLPRLQIVRDDMRPTLLDAEYSFSVTVGNLGDGEDVSVFQSTGLRWPGADRAG